MIGSVMECIAWLSTKKDGVFKVEEYKEKRSLNANSLYWACIDQLAKTLHQPKSYIHNLMLRRMEIPWTYNGEIQYVFLPDNDDTIRHTELDDIYHYKPTSYVWQDRRRYILLKPSHEYNKEEMSRLIDLVTDEMKQCDLIPPQEDVIRKAIERYEKTH